jgi:hypothetical protein
MLVKRIMNIESIAHRTFVVASLYVKGGFCASVTEVMVCIGDKHGTIV